MRTIIIIAFLLSVTALDAQSFLPGSFINSSYRGSLVNSRHLNDSSAKKKWFLTRYSSISTSFTFSKAGSATVLAAPMGLQLNRRLNNNLFAFAGVSVAPAYINFTRSFINAGLDKANPAYGTFKSGSLGIYSRAELGLQYVNDERTFSISGSIGIERSSYPMPLYNQPNYNRSNPVFLP